MGCIPEKTTRGDSDVVETFRVEGSPCVRIACVLSVRTLRAAHGRWRVAGNLRGTRRIRDVEKQTETTAPMDAL